MLFFDLCVQRRKFKNFNFTIAFLYDDEMLFYFKEFFPGDFVISETEESDVSYRDYGVIQTVDHEGRIAVVKWFTTYTSADEPK